MPIPEDYRDICEMLVAATNEKRVKWTEKGSMVAVELPEFSLEIWSGRDEHEERDFVAVSLKDPKASKPIDNWYVEEGEADFSVLHNLWSSARRQARGIPQKLEALRELLRRGGKVGEEDIPF